MCKPAKIILGILGAIVGLFVALFSIYFFNLGMKLMAIIEPYLQKWYDHLDRNQSI